MSESMADSESKEFLNDPNMMTDLDSSLNTTHPSLGDNLFVPEGENLQMIDSFLNNDVTMESTLSDSLSEQNTEPTSEMPSEKEMEKESSSDNCNSNSNEEHHVESPTNTVEVFAFKCIYCDRNLSAADNPKLLECLHNACTGCINSKLFENNESSGSSGEFRVFSVFIAQSWQSVLFVDCSLTQIEFNMSR